MPFATAEARNTWRRAYMKEMRKIQKPLHVRLGISTHVHRQAVTDYHGGYDNRSGQFWSPHQYRESITLAGVA